MGGTNKDEGVGGTNEDEGVCGTKEERVGGTNEDEDVEKVSFLLNETGGNSKLESLSVVELSFTSIRSVIQVY